VGLKSSLCFVTTITLFHTKKAPWNNAKGFFVYAVFKSGDLEMIIHFFHAKIGRFDIYWTTVSIYETQTKKRNYNFHSGTVVYFENCIIIINTIQCKYRSASESVLCSFFLFMYLQLLMNCTQSVHAASILGRSSLYSFFQGISSSLCSLSLHRSSWVKIL